MISAKRRKLSSNEPLTSNQTFQEVNADKPKCQSLNDDCILEILDRINNLTDLCLISQINRKFHELATKRFYRNYLIEARECLSIENSCLIPLNPNVYISCFVDVNTLILTCYRESVTARIIQCYANKPVENRIKTIRFEGNLRRQYVRLPQTNDSIEFGVAIKNVTFSNMSVADNLYQTFLRYFPVMERLTFWKDLRFNCQNLKVENNWLLQRYANIKYFAWHIQNRELMITDELKSFFEINDTIDEFSLLSSDIRTIKMCTLNDIKITELFFIVNNNIEHVLRELKKICAKNNTTRLHLCFPDRCRADLLNHLDILLKLKEYVIGLYFGDLQITHQLAMTINHFQQLQVLQCRVNKMLLNCDGLQNLQEFYVVMGAYFKQNLRQLHQPIKVLTSRLSKLRYIHFHNGDQSLAQFLIPIMVNERNQLNGTENLIIRMKTNDEDFKTSKNMRFNSVKTELVPADFDNELVNPLAYRWNWIFCDYKQPSYVFKILNNVNI